MAPPPGAAYAVSCGWAACAITEPEGEATVFPNLVEGDGTLEAYGPGYAPLPLAGRRGPAVLPQVLAEMRWFLR